MKPLRFVVCMGVLIVGAAGPWAQSAAKPYKVVFDLTSSDPLDQQTASARSWPGSAPAGGTSR